MSHTGRDDLPCYHLRNGFGVPISEPIAAAVIKELADLAESEGRRADEAEAWIAEAQPLIDMLREYQASQGAPMYQAMMKRMLDTTAVPGSIKLKGQQP